MRRFLGLLVLIALSGPVSAKWKAEYGQAPEAVKQWFSSQHNAAGQWCCDQSDGHRFYGAYEFQPDGSVVAHDGGKTYKIEKYKVLSGANPTGSAVWWFVDLDGGRMTYCFSPGSLS